MYKWKSTGKEVRIGDEGVITVTLESGMKQDLIVWIAAIPDTDTGKIKVYTEKNISDSSGLPLFPRISDLGIDKVSDLPKHWPPQAGDVWRTEGGMHYFKTGNQYNSGQIIMAETGIMNLPERTLLSKNPVLVFRIGGW